MKLLTYTHERGLHGYPVPIDIHIESIKLFSNRKIKTKYLPLIVNDHWDDFAVNKHSKLLEQNLIHDNIRVGYYWNSKYDALVFMMQYVVFYIHIHQNIDASSTLL